MIQPDAMSREVRNFSIAIFCAAAIGAMIRGIEIADKFRIDKIANDVRIAVATEDIARAVREERPLGDRR